MESQKIQGLAKSLIPDSGIELTYCERVEKIVTEVFTFIEESSKKY